MSNTPIKGWRIYIRMYRVSDDICGEHVCTGSWVLEEFSVSLRFAPLLRFFDSQPEASACVQGKGINSAGLAIFCVWVAICLDDLVVRTHPNRRGTATPENSSWAFGTEIL